MSTERHVSLPIVGSGPGSQIEDDALDYLVMPRGMSTYKAPVLPEPEASPERELVSGLLREVRARLLEAASGGRPESVPLAQLPAAARALLDQLLGEGEVSAFVRATGSSELQVQESVFTGVWRVIELAAQGGVLQDRLEIGALPELLFTQAQPQALPGAAPLPAAGLMNAPSILAELQEQCRAHVPGSAHVINLTLLPLSAADSAYIDAALGTGCVTILSRGYGNCRIHSTQWPSTWRVHYYNSQDTQILSTIEVCDVPEVACAAPQDLLDSEVRLGELLSFIEEP